MCSSGTMYPYNYLHTCTAFWIFGVDTEGMEDKVWGNCPMLQLACMSQNSDTSGVAKVLHNTKNGNAIHFV